MASAGENICARPDARDRYGLTGARGRLNRSALGELVHDPATLCFVCGPPALVDEMPAILTELGIPRQRIRIEEW